MARGSLSIPPRKSKWVNEKRKPPELPPKPQGRKMEGTLQCQCGENNKVVTHSPDKWFVGNCSKCGKLLTGYVAEEDTC